MKKRLPVLVSASCLFMGALLLNLPWLESGCGTNAPTKAAQAEKILITSVNAGLVVIVNDINAGKLTHKQVDQFNAAYTDYYNAQQILKAVIEKANTAQPGATVEDIGNAQNAVDNAEKSLLAIINQIVNAIK